MKHVPIERRGDYLVKMYELDEEVCAQLLARCQFGRVAFEDSVDGPTILPINAVFADGVVLFRTAPGSLLDKVAGRAVAFETDHNDPVAEAGWSVLVRGTARRVSDPGRVELLDTGDVHPWAPGHRDRWVEIRPRKITGRIVRRQRLVYDEERMPFMPPG